MHTMIEGLVELAPLLEKLGIASALLLVIIMLMRRYDALLERCETRLKEANLDRITDAKAHAALANQYLVTAAQLMQHMSAMVTSTQQTMSTIESIARTMDVIHDRMTRSGERR